MENLTLDQAVDRFDEISREIAHLTAEKRQLGEFIAEQAYAQPHNTNTVRVTSRNGVTLKVEFGSKTEWDAEQIMTVASMVPKDTFDNLFRTKFEFVAQKRNLGTFLGTVTSDERTETAKQIIRNAQIETQKPPVVSIEKSLADGS